MTITTLFSPKGGSGTTTIAATIAVLLARLDAQVVLVDAADGGDLPATLGLPEPHQPGFTDWASGNHGADEFGRLGVAAGAGLALVPHGAGDFDRGDLTVGERLRDLAGDSHLVVDCGRDTNLAGIGDHVLMVLRPCYLALRRALAAPIRATGVILVEEPKRSLDADDVEQVLGVPVRAVVPWDPAIARSVDAGLLGARPPRQLATSLAGIVRIGVHA